MTPAFNRILLKLSGEALMGAQNYGIDTLVAESVAREVKAVHKLGVEIAIVVGGGNIFRGVSKSAGNMDRGAADYIGMLATVMNAVVLQDALEQIDVFTRVMSAIDIPQLAEPFIRRRAIRHLEKSVSSFLRRAPEIRILRPTRRPHCGHARSGLKLFSRPRKLTESTPRTR